MNWDKLVYQQLLKDGFTPDQISKVIGLLAEHRQIADREGYNRGYENGYKHGQARQMR